MEIDNTQQMIAGAVRTVTQGFFAYIIVAASPILSALGVNDEFEALAAPITAFVTAAVLGAYWLGLTWLQQSPAGQNPVVRVAVAFLMGGSKAPTYLDSEVVDA